MGLLLAVGWKMRTEQGLGQGLSLSEMLSHHSWKTNTLSRSYNEGFVTQSRGAVPIGQWGSLVPHSVSVGFSRAPMQQSHGLPTEWARFSSLPQSLLLPGL